MNSTIPKIIHQIWIGKNPMPDHIHEYCQKTRNLYSDYEYMFWNNDNIPEMPEQCIRQMERYEKRNKPAFQADILRYYVANKFGGIYLDVDFVCNRRFDDMIEKPFFCVSPNLRGFHVCNGVFACSPNNNILTKLIDELKSEPYHGPLLFTKYISDFLGVNYRTHIYNYLKENPSDFVQCGDAKDFFRKDGYCFHHALRSWIKNRKK